MSSLTHTFKHFLAASCNSCGSIVIMVGRKSVTIGRFCPQLQDSGFQCAGQLEDAKVGPSVLRAFADSLEEK